MPKASVLLMRRNRFFCQNQYNGTRRIEIEMGDGRIATIGIHVLPHALLWSWRTWLVFLFATIKLVRVCCQWSGYKNSTKLRCSTFRVICQEGEVVFVRAFDKVFQTLLSKADWIEGVYFYSWRRLMTFNLQNKTPSQTVAAEDQWILTDEEPSPRHLRARSGSNCLCYT